MRVLITGGAGYLGSALTTALLNTPTIEKIVIYDQFLRPNHQVLKQLVKHPQCHMIRGDILDREKLAQALNGIDVVFHMAAIVRAPFHEEFTHLFEHVNHWGTAELCSLLENSDVKKLIYLSSGAVYGKSTKPFAITDEPRPSTSYGHSKWNAEKQLKRLHTKLEVITLRLGHVFGSSPAMHDASVINQFHCSLAFREPLLIHGCGNQFRPYIHLSRVVAAMKYFLWAKASPSYSLFNIYDFNISMNQLLNIYQNLRVDYEAIHVNQDQRMNDLMLQGNDVFHTMIGEPEDFAYYIEATLRELGFELQKSDEGVRTVLLD